MRSRITVQQKLAGWQAAERVASAEREAALDPAELLAAAEEIRALNPDAFEGADPIRDREVQAVRNAWKTLHERWQRDGASPRV
jgi:hypothetical protein